MRISDFYGARKKHTVKIVSVENLFGDYYQIKLDSGGIEWTPGEHGIYTLPGKSVEGKKWRAFSVASVPSEGVIMIGTRTGEEISSFKKALINMKPGETIALRGPFGWFKIMDETSPIVMIASGVGITPIRSLTMHLADDKRRDINIIHSSRDNHLFGDDLEEVATRSEKIHLHKTSGREETQSLIQQMTEQYGNEAYYYISGSMTTIRSIKKDLKAHGISGKRMINDPFLGY